MKRLHYCCVWIVVSCLYAVPAGAVLTSHNNSSFVEIISNPNPKFESKPAYPQYASVQFLKSDTNLTFNSDAIGVKAKCASLGYLIPVSQCSSPMMPSYLCSSELNESGADQYTNYCCNSNLYTVTNPDACTDNATALPEGCYWGGSIKYRCACDRSRYPYSTLSGEGCGANGDFNVNNMCRAPNASGEKISYYTSCCPTSYKECDGSKHLVGKGNSCRIESGGTIVNKYEYCECSSSYDTICGYDRLIRTGDEYVCTDDRGRWTRESNCESECSQTKETNIDQYLYGYGWHCLYKKDGATVKTTEGELCAGYDRDTSTSSPTYYDECEKQGYVKSEADCYISELMMRCPNDSSKVWCLDGKYCTGFPVGEDACNDGARMKLCGSREQGVRCAYNDDRCNKCWEDGVYKPGCVNYDSSTKGDSEVCCKRGYRMADGICVKNVCDRTKFPYEQNPGSDQGQLEFCYAGDEDASLGYKTYFGYASCYSDAATGGMWKPADDNPRKCVCMRKDDDNSGRTWLPFDLSLYFANNLDTSDNYTRIGFNEGAYGNTADCTDAEGSYYGYSSCFIGKASGTTDANKGMCLQAPQQVNGYFHQGWGEERYFYALTTAAGAPITSWPSTSGIYCISQYNHCKSPTGQQLGDEKACALVVSGCNQGNEEACNLCYHVGNLVKGSNGLFTPHNKYLLQLNYYNNSGTHMYFERCPDGYVRAGQICRKTCSVNDYASCNLGDILLDKDGTQIGGVYVNTLILYKTVSQHTLGITALTHISRNWNEAVTYAAGYAPAGKESDAVFGKGKWSLPTNGTGINQTLLSLYPHAPFNGAWSRYEDTTNSSNAFYFNYVANLMSGSKLSYRTAIPVILITYTH